jgi:hypothetical protein
MSDNNKAASIAASIAASKNSNKKQKARELAIERSDVATGQQTTITRQYIYPHFYLFDVAGWLLVDERRMTMHD